MIIGITDNISSEHKLRMYFDWIKQNDPAIECVKLSYKLQNLSALQQCDGVILTGGGDVDPALYGGDPRHPTLYGVDAKRDDFERTVIDAALKNATPLLGVCRGLQLANVHLGGTLIQDLTERGHGHHQSNDADTRHDLQIEQSSRLCILASTTKGNVNSAHHQAVNTPGERLRVVARSDDGIIEAMELHETNTFFQLVQWHPERMYDKENPLTKRLREQFLLATSTNNQH